jgi:Type I restriction-modification system methyltransferase subunit
MAGSIEQKVSQWADDKLRNLGWKIHGAENMIISDNIAKSLKKNLSKSGGTGGGIPDYSLIIDNGDKQIPVIIEYKGTKNKLEKLDKQNLVILRNDVANFDYKNAIPQYAVNGAAYYAMNVAKDTDFEEVLAIGVNGYEDKSRTFHSEIKVYVLNKKNPELPIFLGEFDNFDFLKNEKVQKKSLFQKIEDIQTDPHELEQRAIRDDAKIEAVLQALNQKIHDENQIIPSQRINIVAGLLMAAVGVKDVQGDWKVARLNPSELKGSSEEGNTDGEKIVNKIKNFLKERDIPEQKQRQIINVLMTNFVDNNLNQKSVTETQTPLKTIYEEIYNKLIPIYDVTGINDFTGKLFNVMNSWVDVPDGGANDVVLTPRYITEFMAKLTRTNMNSYVWDWALGSGGFLISAMNLMITDAQTQYSGNLTEERKKIEHIKTKQLLGIELLSNVYMLAVLNMILMGDGSSNIVNENALTKYDGKYAYNENPFPADVFLLNPPYSAEGNGMIFVEKAFQKQEKGYGVVIIQDSAGSGKAIEINKRILQKNKLKASIKMPVDLFKASVQTSIYLFEVGKPHKADDNVYFIDLREDGYTRTNRKKAKNNLVNSNDAKGHYQEVLDIILDKAKKTNYFTENDNYYKGTIDINSGKDWNYSKKIDTEPSLADFKKTVSDYLTWEVSTILNSQNKDDECLGK